eukprot:747394-Hanusia_phi.AAC.5
MLHSCWDTPLGAWCQLRLLLAPVSSSPAQQQRCRDEPEAEGVRATSPSNVGPPGSLQGTCLTLLRSECEAAPAGYEPPSPRAGGLTPALPAGRELAAVCKGSVRRPGGHGGLLTIGRTGTPGG